MSLSNYASGLNSEAKTRYLEKLQMFNSDYPYCISNSLWKHGLDCCSIVPKISASDIFIYVVETKSYENHLVTIHRHNHGYRMVTIQAPDKGFQMGANETVKPSLFRTEPQPFH